MLKRIYFLKAANVRRRKKKRKPAEVSEYGSHVVAFYFELLFGNI